MPHPAPEPSVTDAIDLSIAAEDPLAPDLDLIFRRHAAEMHADTPPESIHMLPRAALASAQIDFFVLRRQGRAVAIGALKRWGGHQGEVKSMHVLAEHRGQGLSRLMLRHLIAHARDAGLSDLWLETGSQTGFAAARGLYLRAGFAECPPFGDYRPDPNSVYMTRRLQDVA
ncbi:GNAT family N-acetyltransferase [Paracoccus spongiarum]|uniref:GNAT family N-acetyltransferase n=1 Tax=Paracoccus spongiarum TaxID=3064387 RepID=A0ABT9JGI3_9RHOB|nr:GNAT family N-acetyltransferase [Paracoccus sp. 2205BS29-5]MDP5308923.1 GNAT family N-acetyltransferase [Paracoccus sp. 2205BS29-5]